MVRMAGIVVLMILLALIGLALWIGLPRTPSSSDSTMGQPRAASISDMTDAQTDSSLGGGFSDVTAASGVRFAYHNGEEAGYLALLESLGGGVALFDANGDGKPDLFAPGGGRFGAQHEILGLPNCLYHNDGNWHFTEITEQAGLRGGEFYSHGCAVGDFNNDGFPDLLVTGWGRVALYRNQGDGTFRNITQEAGLDDRLWSTSAAIADFDGDGIPDLYIAHYTNWSFRNNPTCHSPSGEPDVCGPKEFQPLPHVLYFGNGDGTFRSATASAGLRPDGKGLGVLAADFNDDGRVDLYVANDTTENFLYINRGGGRFEEVGMQKGVAVDDRGIPNGSMGVDVTDYDGDGRADIGVANFENEAFALYRQEAAGVFGHISQSAGLASIGSLLVGFGTIFLDADSDGWDDLFISNGHILHHPARAPLRQRPVLFRNTGRGRFEDVSRRLGPYFRGTYLGRGAASADLDDDGDPDLVLSPMNEPITLLRNDIRTDHRWLRVTLVGTRSERDAVGARVVVQAGGRRQTRYIKSGGSYLSHSDRRALFGLGPAMRIERVTVFWPSGQRQELRNLPCNQGIILVEPSPGRSREEERVGRTPESRMR